MRRQVKTRKMLSRVGVRKGIGGYDYLLDAVEIAKGFIERDERLRGNVMWLYCEVAKLNGVDPINVERCMRYAIVTAHKEKSDEYLDLFDHPKRIPQNYAFIITLAEALYIEEQEES